MEIIAYLMFDGNCEEALNFYKEVLKGEIVFLQRYKDAPGMNVAEKDKEKVLHAKITFGENSLYFSDSAAYQPAQAGNGNIALTLEFENVEEQKRVFDMLAKEGQIHKPLEEQFWGSTYGSVIDKFGFYWGLNFRK